MSDTSDYLGILEETHFDIFVISTLGEGVSKYSYGMWALCNYHS